MTEGQPADLRIALEALSDKQKRWGERFGAEVEFAEGLARLDPTRASRWGKLIDKARRLVAEAVASGGGARLPKAVRTAEEVLAPVGKVAKGFTVHCAGHAHIDMNWMWSWPETVAVTNDTFRTVLNLMDEFDDFCFTQSQISVYEIIRRHNPGMFERIKRRVKEGRWEIAACHWVEGDKNLASGESLARHLLYSRRYLAEHFGLSPKDVPLDWEPDTFGHAASIPSIISRGGVKRYYFCRGGKFEKPPVFWWRGPDGSRVLCNREIAWYNGRIDAHCASALLYFHKQTRLKDWLCVYGVGDHGGGPTRRDILRCREMNAWPVFPTFRLATTRDYFRIVERRGEKLPVLEGELNFEFPGCYTSQSEIKKANRFGENAMVESETAAVLASRAIEAVYPAELIREGWVNVLFGHFHDILPGSGVAGTRRYQLGRFQETVATAGIIRTEAYRGIAGKIDTMFAASLPPASRAERAPGAGAGRGTDSGGVSSADHAPAGQAVLAAFNPVACDRHETVTVTLWDPDFSSFNGDAGRACYAAVFDDGLAIPAQILDRGHYWGHDFVELAVPVSVPSLGFTAFAIAPSRTATKLGEWWADRQDIVATVGAPTAYEAPVKYAGLAMENEHLAVKLDARTGGIISLVDKAGGVDLAVGDEPMGVLEYAVERWRGMTAWEIGDIQKRICPLELTKFSAKHRGPHVASVVAKARLDDSELTVTYSLKAGQPWLDITVEAMWLHRGNREIGTPSLRMVFPLALRGARGRYEIPFGWIAREQTGGEEVPALRWADISGKTPGGNEGGDGAAERLQVRALARRFDASVDAASFQQRSRSAAGNRRTHDAAGPVPARRRGGALRTGAPRRRLQSPAARGFHRRSRRDSSGGAAASVGPKNVILSALKRAEDDDATVFRLYETNGRDATAKVALDNELLGRVGEVVDS